MKSNTIKEYSIEQKYKILGFNDEQCICDICGKQELKGTYAIEDLQSGEIFRAGSSCGANMAGWSKKELVAKYKAGEKEKLDAAKKEFRNSEEYNNYIAAIDFLNKESEELERKLYNCYDAKVRAEIVNEIRAKERSVESRFAYIEPYKIALSKKRAEVVSKYNFPEKTYLG